MTCHTRKHAIMIIDLKSPLGRSRINLISRFSVFVAPTLESKLIFLAHNHYSIPQSCRIIKKAVYKFAPTLTYRQQPSPLLYSIEIWPTRNSRLTQRETNHYIARCASVLAWSYLAEGSPEQLVIDLIAQHQRFVVCCP